MSLKNSLIIFSIFISVSPIWSQDFHFSQVENTPLLYNPSHTGAINGDLRASTHYRTQWASIANPYVTYGLSFDVKLKKKNWRNKHFGIGFILLNDKAGDLDLKRFKGNAQIAYHQKLNAKNFFSGGANIGFVQHSINMSNAQWDNQYDGFGYNPSLPSGEVLNYPSFMVMDVSAGLLWTYATSHSTISSDDSKLIQLGLAVSHVNSPKTSFLNAIGENYYWNYIAHGISSIGISNTNTAIKPSFLYQRKGKEQEFVVGLMIRQRLKEKSHFTGFISQFDFSYGTYYRWISDAIIPSVQLNYANWSVGLSYDVNLSKLSSASKYRGGFELSLKFVTPNPYSRSSQSFPSL